MARRIELIYVWLAMMFFGTDVKRYLNEKLPYMFDDNEQRPMQMEIC
jgi:hypothetical protein